MHLLCLQSHGYSFVSGRGELSWSASSPKSGEINRLLL
jgi:hypothetical protein